MTAIKAILENGSLFMQEPLPTIAGRVAALVIISEETPPSREAMDSLQQKIAPAEIPIEEEFEAFGLKDFFGDPKDENINWEAFFNSSK